MSRSAHIGNAAISVNRERKWEGDRDQSAGWRVCVLRPRAEVALSELAVADQLVWRTDRPFGASRRLREPCRSVREVGGFQGGDLVVGEAHIDRGHGVSEMMLLGRPDDRTRHGRVVQHPRQRDLRHARTTRLGDLLDRIHDGLIEWEVVRLNHVINRGSLRLLTERTSGAERGTPTLCCFGRVPPRRVTRSDCSARFSVEGTQILTSSERYASPTPVIAATSCRTAGPAGSA